MKRYILFLSAALVCSVYSKGQSISGRVMENDSTSISFATVSLLQANDSTYILGDMSNEDGSFSFNASPANKLVRISYIGYKTIVLPAKECMTVLLEPSEQSMKEVVVTATRPTFKLDKGMFISNIQGTVYSKLGKAIDVLQQLPMMGSNGVSVLGRGTPLVYINNKLMRSWNELERIPSNMIKEIKIDMNPGSKYSSNVRAVLFITTLKPVGEGLGGTLTMKESVSSCWETDGWLDLNYRTKGLDVFLSSSFGTFANSHYKRQDTYDFQHAGKNINARYVGDGYNSSKSGFVSIGFNNQFTNNQSLGATYTFNRLFASNSNQNFHNYMQKDNVLTEFGTSAHQFLQNGNHNVSLYYENKFSNRLTLNIDGTYAHNNSNGKQTVVDVQNSHSSTLVPVTETNSDMAALKTVFTSSVGNAKLEYGFETTYTHFHQKYNVENNNYTGVLTANDNSSEQKAANVFANYSRSFGKLYTQLGVKYEYADYDYFDNGKLLSSSSRTYHRILPSVYFSYPINRLSLMLSYNIYAQCPSYSQLDEGMQYISDFRYNKGNSLLRPTYEHEISFNASYGDFQFITNYSYQKDAIITWFEVMQQIPAILSSDVNHSYSSLYASLSYAPTLFRIWKPSWNIWGNKQWLTYDGLRYNRPQIGLQWKNLFILPKNWFIVLNTNGNRRGNVDTYMAQPTIRMDFAIQKNMKNWWIKLSALNIFNAKEKGYSRYAKIYTSHYVDNRQPTICLTVSYSFNPPKSKYKGQTAGQSELNRLSSGPRY